MAHHEQSYANSCGPTSLLCAAHELGVTEIPLDAHYTLLAAGPNPLALTQACETQLYQVTSNNPQNIDVHNWGYSMPSQVVVCARMLGLQAWAVAYRTWTVRGLKIGYRDELNALRDNNALIEPGGSAWRRNRSTFKPVMHQRELKVLVNRRTGGLHYVMIRPDGTVMDPADGHDHADIRAAERIDDETRMHGTGLSVFVSS